jgi:hypothetical protein
VVRLAPDIPSISRPIDRLKEMQGLIINNIVFEGIRRSIADEMNLKVNGWAKEYDWDWIKFTTSQTMEDLIMIGSLPREEGEAVIQFVYAISPCADVLTDRQNKYRALQRVMKSSSFKDLRLRLQRK